MKLNLKINIYVRLSEMVFKKGNKYYKVKKNMVITEKLLPLLNPIRKKIYRERFKQGETGYCGF